MTKGIDLNAAVLATLANDCNCTVTATVKLDEDGLPGGIPGGNGDAPGTAVTATGNLGYSFGNNGPASSGAFTWKLDDAPSLTSAGEDVTFTLSNDGRTAIGTTGNGDTVLTLVLTDVASGSYKITLSKPLDHPISGTEDDLVFSFDYAIADSQGGEAQARMVVVVDDDTPESSVIFPTSIQDGDSISGSWSVDGGADGVASTVVSLPGNTNQYPLNTPIDTGLGTLIVRDNGTWSFNVDDDLDTSQDPKLIFDIVTTDGDGDTVHSNVCIPIVDGGDGVPTTPETDGDPATVAPTVTVDEDGLPGGIAGGNGDVPGQATSVSGTIGYDFGDDGPAASNAFRWSTDGLPALTSKGQDISYSLSGNGRSIVGFNDDGDRVLSIQLTDVAKGTYKVAIAQPLDHSDPTTEDDIRFSVGYTITDSDGDSADGKLNVVIDDDTPVAASDFATTDSDTPVTVDVLDNDQLGADGGSLTNASVQGGSNVGTVTTQPNGMVTFTPHPNFSGNAVITYTVTDGDGDPVTGKLKVKVEDGSDVPTTPETDGDPTTKSPTATVDEDGLPGGIAGGDGDVPGEATSVTGSLGYDFGDDGPGGFSWSTNGLPSLTSQGESLDYFLSNNGHTLTAFDEGFAPVFSVKLTNQASGAYRVTLFQPLDHSDPTTEDDISFSVGYTITDSDGDSADGKLNVRVDDDTPVAASDFATTDSDTPVTVDVLDNDQLGADGGSLTNASVQGGSNVGTVTTQPNGTVTFTPHPNFSGNALITYTVTDGDGDPVTGKLKVKVEDGGDVPTTPETDGDPTTKSPTATVDEDGLPGGIAGGDGDVPGEATSVTGSLGYDFGNDGPGGFSWSTNGLPSLTSQGESLDYFLSNNGHTLTAFDEGFAPVFSVELTNQASGAYRVTLFQPLDHSDPTTEDDIRFSVGYTITDSDGDSADGRLNVVIDDDTPVAASDFATTDSDTPVTVDVLDNDQLGADGGNLTAANVQGGSNVGTVTTQPNGTVTFTPHPNFSGNALITYTVTDGDGDPVTGKLKVKVEDGGDVPTTPETDGDPTTKSPTATVDEDGLPGGIAGGDGDVPGEATTVTGSLGYDFGNDGPGGFSWSTNGLPSLTSQGESLDYFLSNNGHTLTAFDEGFAPVFSVELTNQASGAYRATLFQPLDHSDPTTEDDIRFSVGYTITDSDGDSADGKLNVRVDDDTPVAASDFATTDSDTPVTVDVLDNDQLGADGGNLTAANVQGGSNVGTVTTQPNGTVTFTPHPNFSGNALITYTVTDGDGDPVTGKLKVKVEDGGDVPTTPESDGDPTTKSPTATVDEDGLPGGIAGGDGDVPGEATTVTGSLGYDFGDDGAATNGAFRWSTSGLPNLTSQGDSIRYFLSDNDHTLTAFDEGFAPVFSVELTNQASGAYRVTLFQPLDHSDPTTEDDIRFSVGYTITDSDGDSADGKLNVRVDDDTPVAASDFATTDSDTPVTVDVLDNDQLGADGGNLTAANVQGGSNVGTVTTQPNGTVTFTPHPNFSGNAVITYTVTDGDGDPVTGKLKVKVEDGGDVPTTPESDGDPTTKSPTATVDEDGLPGGIAGGDGDVPGEATTVTGSLGYDFGDDGPATNGAFRWSASGLPNLTANGSPISYFLSNNDKTLIGFDSNFDQVISVELTNQTSGAYRVTLSQPLDHSDPTTEDDIRFSVGYTVTDSDGDSADGKLNVRVDDDTPVAALDTASTESDTPVTVAVLDNDRLGADGGDLTAATVQGGDRVGNVRINPDSSLTFTPNPSFTGNALIGYTITDGDGDPVTGRLRIKVEDDNDIPTTPETDGDPTTNAPTATLDEDGLPNGIPGGIADVPGETVTVTGTIGYDFGDDGPAATGAFRWSTDGLPSLTSDGRDINWVTESANGQLLTGYDTRGNPIVTIELTDRDSGSYRVTLDAPLDHPTAGIEDDIAFAVGYTVTDSDGDSADGNLNIVIDDDTPTARDDSATTAPDDTVIIDVLANDSLGADGGRLTGATVQGGSAVGTVRVTGDENLAFTPNDGFSGNATIDYFGVDTDGDPLQARVRVTVAPDELYVGENTDDTKETGAGRDVLIGDIGGINSIIQEGKNYNISIIMDSSESMRRLTAEVNSAGAQFNRSQVLLQVVGPFLEDLSEFDGTINLQLVVFGNNAIQMSIDTYEGTADWQTARSYAGKNVRANQATNIEAGLRLAEQWHAKQVVANDYENISVLLSDGHPTMYMAGINNNTPRFVANVPNLLLMQETLGAFQDLAQYAKVNAIGLSNTPISTLQFWDNTDTVSSDTTLQVSNGIFTAPSGEIDVVNNAGDLDLALRTGSMSTNLAPLGNDTLDGGAGDDIIFGDTVNSDDLTWTNGDSDETFSAGAHDGLGYQGLFEFLKWSPGYGDGQEPSDDQIIDYVRANYASLMEPNREDGGDDTLRGGQGDDIIIAGGGLDLIDGGAGDDLMWGNLGSDTFAWSAGDAGSTDQPANDVIRDFTLGRVGADANADTLDLSDLLDGATENDVSNYLTASQERSDVVLAVNSGGNISADGSNADQTITLTGVNLGGNGEDFINNLINNGQLDVA